MIIARTDIGWATYVVAISAPKNIINLKIRHAMGCGKKPEDGTLYQCPIPKNQAQLRTLIYVERGAQP